MSVLKIKTHGFTIVELMIVIVVIAILASISIVAYTGVQERALNTSRVSAARQALNLLEVYRVTHGSYPELPERPVPSGNIRGACIGTGWPTIPGVESPVCWDIFQDGQGPSGSTYVESDSFNAALAEFGTLPSYPQQPATDSIQVSSGRPLHRNALALYWHRNGNDTYQPGYTLVYFMPPDSQCGLSNADPYALETAPHTVYCRVHLGE